MNSLLIVFEWLWKASDPVTAKEMNTLFHKQEEAVPLTSLLGLSM